MSSKIRYKNLVFDEPQEEKSGVLRIVSKRPLLNTYLGWHLGILSYIRIGDILKKMTEYSQLKYAMFASLIDCGSMEDFFPQKERAKRPKTSSELISESQAQTQAMFQQRIEKYKQDNKSLTYDGFRYNLDGNNADHTTGIFLPQNVVGKFRYVMSSTSLTDQKIQRFF